MRAQPVSALTGEGISGLLNAIQQAVEEHSRAAPVVAIKTYRLEPEESDFSIVREPAGFRVQGRRVERIVAMSDMDTDQGLGELQRVLERMGVYRALREAGVEEGDTVQVGEFELEWT